MMRGGRCAAGVLVLVAAQACAARRPPATTAGRPQSPPAIDFIATAYCHGTTTASGARARPGIVAADPAVLPLGTVIRLQRAGRYDGPYTVLDTGPGVRGRRIDVFMRDCREARTFGRRSVSVSIIQAADHQQ